MCQTKNFDFVPKYENKTKYFKIQTMVRFLTALLSFKTVCGIFHKTIHFFQFKKKIKITSDLLLIYKIRWLCMEKLITLPTKLYPFDVQKFIINENYCRS